MKKMIFAIVFFTTIVSNMFSQNGVMFEYKITSTKGITGNVVANVSPIGSRVEIQIKIPQMPSAGISSTSIVKSSKPTTVYILNDKNKTYSTTETQATKTSNNENRTVKIIGKEKIGKYNCTHAIVTKGNESSDFWTTTEITDFEKYNKSNVGNKYMGSGDDYAALAKSGAAGFIVKTITKENRGGDITMELVKLEKIELSAKLFEIPADYKASTSAITPGAPAMDATQLQNMTPEQRAKYIEDLKKQYQIPAENK